MAALEIIGKRIERHRSGGVDGPDPTGFILSISKSGSALLVVHDLGLHEGTPLSIAAEGGAIRIIRNGRPVLQTRDEGDQARASLSAAARIQVLETSSDGVPLRIHDARLAD